MKVRATVPPLVSRRWPADADGTDSVTYSLFDDAGGRFTIDANTGEVTVADTSLLDYETATSHDVTVTATSSDGSTSNETFTINLTDDTSEASVGAVTDSDASGNSVDESASNGAVVGITALASDADGTDSVTYSLFDDAGGLFAIDANTGVVTVAGSLDAETATSHNITVLATSTDGTTSNATFAIAVNDLNETAISAISDSDGATNQVSEAATIGTAVGVTALATDADVTDTVSYSLSSNPGGLFAIDANTGVVTVAGALDFETATSHNIEVTATSTDGSTSNETFAINLTDVDEYDVGAVTDSDGAADQVGENASIGTAVGVTALATDADAGDSISYSLSSNPGGFFAIDANTGEVTVAGALDFETATSHNIEVTATSTDGSTSNETFAINLTDVDEYDVGAVTDSDGSGNSVSESASNGSSVGVTALASDADGTDSVTYSLFDDAGGRFTIDANTGEVTVADTSLLDYETATSHDVTVTATSSDGSTSNETFTINLTDDTSEASVGAVTDSDASGNSVDESASNGSSVGVTALASDADGTDSVTYSLCDDAGGRFTSRRQYR